MVGRLPADRDFLSSLGANLIFAVRISNFFSFFCEHIYLRNETNNLAALWGSNIYIPSEQSPEFQMSHNHTIKEAICSWQNHYSDRA